jgi:hypothetical protein
MGIWVAPSEIAMNKDQFASQASQPEIGILANFKST